MYSFEQFCINFANEKLQQHFNEHVFKMEQEEYQKEAINWSYIEFIDNQDVLDLIEKWFELGTFMLEVSSSKPLASESKGFAFWVKLVAPGLPSAGYVSYVVCDIGVGVLPCAHPKGSLLGLLLFWMKLGIKYVDAISDIYSLLEIMGVTSPYLDVTYKTETFLDKNRDYVVVEHRNLLSSSECPFIADLFPSLGEESSRSSYKFSSVASRFKVVHKYHLEQLLLQKQQLQALMETLSTTEPHYIRCVKPNSLNRPQKFENVSILHQLRCGGVLEAVRISLAGYPTRRTYHEFIDRFGLIVLDMLDGSNDEKTITEKILQKLKLGNYQLGKTKVFLRAGQIGILDSRRAEILDLSAKQIQSRLRTFLARRDFLSNRMAAIHLQSCCRGYIARSIYAALREASAVIVIQKYVRQWIMRNAYLQLYASALMIQSCTRGFAARQKFLHRKENKAATIIQAHWRMCKIRSAFRHRHSNIIAIQCLWRRKMATREFRRLKKEANEAGALRLAKTKLERQLEDLTWRLQLEKKLRLSNEEAKLVEISKLNKTVESLILELDAAKLAAVNEVNKNAVLQRQLELYMKEKAALEREIFSVTELRNENTFLKSSLSALEEKNSALEHELIKGKEESTDTIAKLRAVEETCSQLQQNLKSMEEKLSISEDENHILRQKALSATPRSNRPGFAKSFSDKFSGALALPSADRKTSFESPTPTKMIAPLAQGFSDSRRAKLTSERQQENCEILSRCIKENLGFKDGKPVAACVIYRCLIHWHAFESERTAIFDFIIAEINEVLKVGDEDVTLPYWLSNASALLCLLQRNLRANGFFSTSSQRSGGVSALNGRVAQSLKSPLKFIGLEDGMSHMEARYPALLFKQQLTACVEKIFGLIRDNLKKEISPLLGLCIQLKDTIDEKLPKAVVDLAKKGTLKPIKHCRKSSISQLKNKKSNLLEAKENSTSEALIGIVPMPSTPNIEKEALCCTNMPACDSAMALMQEDVAKVEVPNSWAGSIEAKGSLSSDSGMEWPKLEEIMPDVVIDDEDMNPNFILNCLEEEAPKIQRVHGGKSTRSPGGIPQQAPSSQWDSIIKFLDSFLSRLRGNHVPSFFIRKLTTQVFSFINISLFNSLLLRRECCTFSNGEYVKSGLAELEKWIVNAKEEFAGTSWHELNYIRQAVGFLVIHQKRKKSLEEIRQDLCPALTTRQIYRISTMYWDDKYGTQSVSNEVVAQMREILNKDSQNLTSNSFLLDDDLSIPFLTEDIYMALPELDPSLMELPKFLSEYPSALLMIQHTK
ncbi:hypothetical protein MTR67_035528 [Solanum verrucosum]|uniref:Myosin-15 n=1 Tax=Solanum verrucosum TaxID=315347 RepID=A0AAF0U9N8_SOLVR|nr:hypothetical protein MTR67_035528 [Solanum verrucosum]